MQFFLYYCLQIFIDLGAWCYSIYVKPKETWDCTPLIAFNVLLVKAMMLSFWCCWAYFIPTMFGYHTSIPDILCEIGLLFLVDDTTFYLWHRLLHSSHILFQKIHKIHHVVTDPFPIAYIYAHPIEVLGGWFGLGLVFIFKTVSIYSLFIYGILRQLHEIWIHSQDSDVFLKKWMPWLATIQDHNYHHMYRNGNYASLFVWMDYIGRSNLSCENVKRLF
jgi:sterol desaturase/sphingolipid hydroxylase (fatty acid hydroxylase superfamily)